MENNPVRKPTRLKNFDYSSEGYYFITICTKDKQKILCNVVGEGLRALPKIELSKTGAIVDESINFINNNYENVFVDKYVIMPNHVHLLIGVTGGHGDPPLQITNIIGNFKSFTTNKYGGTLWQRSFHDHIIRDKNDYKEIWEYIENNPIKWDIDEFYTK